MIAEDIACCLMCNTTFATHEELFVHSCAQIKLETNELEVRKVVIEGMACQLPSS